jgi:hypothetical protein
MDSQGRLWMFVDVCGLERDFCGRLCLLLLLTLPP